MIYVCIPSHDEGPTVGLVLWKIRKVFSEFGREYQLLVTDDASSDRTGETLAPYLKVLPLTVVRNDQRVGYAGSVEALLRLALDRSDRPRRDFAVVMHADFSHGPQFLPEMVRQMESGADLVVAEATLSGEPSLAHRILRRMAPRIVGGVKVEGVRDTVSGFVAVRLSSLRLALKDREERLLETDGWAANAELIARLSRQARRIESVSVVERHDLRARPSRIEPWAVARELWGARRAVRMAASAT